MYFPCVREASNDGLLAVGADLSPERLLLAYRSGIFPWFNENQPVLWWSPNPRMVLFPEKLRVTNSLQKTVASNVFIVTFNTSFVDVIQNCASIKRKGQEGTWITSKMIEAYHNLYNLGHIISVEVWNDKGALVGGLYGIDLPNKKVFCGESMFSKTSNASKVGFYYLIEKLKKQSYCLVDCQVYSAHMESLGAEEISRELFLSYLKRE